MTEKLLFDQVGGLWSERFLQCPQPQCLRARSVPFASSGGIAYRKWFDRNRLRSDFENCPVGRAVVTVTILTRFAFRLSKKYNREAPRDNVPDSGSDPRTNVSRLVFVFGIKKAAGDVGVIASLGRSLLREWASSQK